MSFSSAPLFESWQDIQRILVEEMGEIVVRYSATYSELIPKNPSREEDLTAEQLIIIRLKDVIERIKKVQKDADAAKGSLEKNIKEGEGINRSQKESLDEVFDVKEKAELASQKCGELIGFLSGYCEGKIREKSDVIPKNCLGYINLVVRDNIKLAEQDPFKTDIHKTYGHIVHMIYANKEIVKGSNIIGVLDEWKALKDSLTLLRNILNSSKCKIIDDFWMNREVAEEISKALREGSHTYEYTPCSREDITNQLQKIRESNSTFLRQGG